MSKGATKFIGLVGQSRMIDLRGMELDYRVARKVSVEGFTDISESLSVGVIVLAHQGAVVYVARADATMLATVATLRRKNIPLLPKIEFDQVLVRRVAPDRADALVASLIAEHRPKHNLPPPTTRPESNFRRRI